MRRRPCGVGIGGRRRCVGACIRFAGFRGLGLVCGTVFVHWGCNADRSGGLHGSGFRPRLRSRLRSWFRARRRGVPDFGRGRAGRLLRSLRKRRRSKQRQDQGNGFQRHLRISNQAVCFTLREAHKIRQTKPALRDRRRGFVESSGFLLLCMDLGGRLPSKKQARGNKKIASIPIASESLLRDYAKSPSATRLAAFFCNLDPLYPRDQDSTLRGTHTRGCNRRGARRQFRTGALRNSASHE